MKFSKLKKAVSAVTAAVMSFTIAFGTVVSADNSDVWKETKALTSAKYSSKYINLMEKYSAKESKNTLTFGKSRMKKFFDKYNKAVNKDEPQIAVNFINRDSIISLAAKDQKMKIVMYFDGEGIAIYASSNKMTLLSVADKEMLSMTVPDDSEYSDSFDEAFGNVDISKNISDVGLDDSIKGKVFKFRSDEKIYIYEEFETENVGKIGMLFNENGKPLATIDEDMSACMSVSYSVKGSEFKIPSEYLEIDV